MMKCGEAKQKRVCHQLRCVVFFVLAVYQWHELLSSNDGSGDIGIDSLTPKVQINLLNRPDGTRLRVDNHSRKTVQRSVGFAVMATLGFRFTDRLQGVLGVDEADVGSGGGELFLVDD